MENSQNRSGKGSKHLTDNRKWFNMLYIKGEQEGCEIVEPLGWSHPLSLGQVQISSVVKYPLKSFLVKKLYRPITFWDYFIKTQHFPSWVSRKGERH